MFRLVLYWDMLGLQIELYHWKTQTNCIGFVLFKIFKNVLKIKYFAFTNDEGK